MVDAQPRPTLPITRMALRWVDCPIPARPVVTSPHVADACFAWRRSILRETALARPPLV